MEKVKGAKKGVPAPLVLRAQGPGPPRKTHKPVTKSKPPEDVPDLILPPINPAKPAPLMLMNNLPYMGELTFGDGRPRRGRKPKKADICHLISKNYGITFPQAYVNEPNSTVVSASSEAPHQAEGSKGRGLLRGRRRGETHRPSFPPELLPLNLLMDSVVRLSGSPSPPLSPDQPLNLCIRDSVGDGGSSIRHSHARPSRHPTPRDSPLVNFNLSPNTFITRRPPERSRQPTNSNISASGASKRKRGGGGVGGSRACSNKSSGSGKKGPVDKFSSPSSAAAAAAAVAASNSAQVSICKFKFTGGAKPCLQEKKMLSVDSGGNFRFYSDKPCTATSPRGPQGRGGVSPSSGPTPSDSALPLPKSAKSMSMCMMPALASAATFTATTPSALSTGGNEVMRWEQEGAGASPASTRSTSPPCSSSDDGDSPPSPHHGSGGQRKHRRTRKALARERLERTFKEKGFLIQTQQLESAEGATYCKFRQLRKFTRYLFRSWKDYLPDTVKEIGQGPSAETEAATAAVAAHEAEPEPDSDSGSD